MEQRFAIRLGGDPELDAVVRASGLDPATVRLELEAGFAARGIDEVEAARLMKAFDAADIEAHLVPIAALPPKAAPADQAPPFNPEVMSTTRGFAAIAPPRTPKNQPPPRGVPNQPPPRNPSNEPPPRIQRLSRRPAIFPEERAAERRRLSQPPRPVTPSVPPVQPASPSPMSRQVLPLVVAGVMIILSGVLVAWAWLARDAAVRALRQADEAVASQDYARALVAARRARELGAGALADRIETAARVGPKLDTIEARVARGELEAAQRDLLALRTVAPNDRRTLALSLKVTEARLLVDGSAVVAGAPAAQNGLAPKTEAPAAPKGLAPKTEAPAAPKTEAPAAPKTEAPKTEAPAAPKTEAPAAPKTEAPAAPKTEAPAAPKTEAPAAPNTEAPPPAKRRSVATDRAADRSTVARLKILSDQRHWIAVDGEPVYRRAPSWIEVTPGRHTVGLLTPGGRQFISRKVSVKAGRQATLRLQK